MTIEELTTAFEELRAATVPPIGTVVAYAGVLPNDAHGQPITDAGQPIEVSPNWFLCNGAAFDSHRFNELHDKLRSSHGNGSDDVNPATDFNLPDYRGLFLRGVNGARTGEFSDPNHGEDDRKANHRGGTGVGNLVGSVQMSILGKHLHELTDPKHSHPFSAFRTDGAGGVGQGFPRDSNGFGTETASTGITIKESGGAETRSKNAYVHYIIRAK